MNNKLEESFSWVKPEELPESNLLKVIAKSTTPTIHPDDPLYRKRLFLENELMKGARSMIYRPVGINHERIIHGAYVVDAEWDEEDKVVEAVLAVPERYVRMVKDGKIDKCSIEFGWRSEVEKDDGIAFEGLWIQRIDLLEGLEPGDPHADVTLFESKKGGRIRMELKEKELTEPKELEEGCVWSTQWDSPEACIAANQDKEDPEAYCMAKIESKTEQVEEPIVETPKEEVKEIVEEVIEVIAPEVSEEEKEEIAEVVAEEVTEEEEPSVDELKESLERVLKANKELKESIDEKVQETVKSAKEEMVKKIESVIPHNMIIRRFGLGSQRFVQEIKKILREVREE